MENNMVDIFVGTEQPVSVGDTNSDNAPLHSPPYLRTSCIQQQHMYTLAMSSYSAGSIFSNSLLKSEKICKSGYKVIYE